MSSRGFQCHTEEQDRPGAAPAHCLSSDLCLQTPGSGTSARSCLSLLPIAPKGSLKRHKELLLIAPAAVPAAGVQFPLLQELFRTCLLLLLLWESFSKHKPSGSFLKRPGKQHGLERSCFNSMAPEAWSNPQHMILPL